jgi:DNA-binding NtrC family response regulator
MLVLQSNLAPEPAAESGEFSIGRFEMLPLHAALEQFERDYTTRLLEETGGNVAKAARRAGVNRATMFRIIGKHGLRKSRAARAE